MLPDTGSLAKLDALPLASAWPLGGITVFAERGEVRIHWTITSYCLNRSGLGRHDERLHAT